MLLFASRMLLGSYLKRRNTGLMGRLPIFVLMAFLAACASSKKSVLVETGTPNRSLRVKDLPKEVIAHCLGRDGRIADVDEDFYATDEVDKRHLPSAHLAYACLRGTNRWRLYCEAGGFSPVRFAIEMH
ncbi:MAG: hypothetical protein ACXWR1_14385, partial [Bdellovibrionota bacterium]